MNKLTIDIGAAASEGDNSKYVHPYMKNNFNGTEEIRETFKRISKRHKIESYS